MVPTLDKMLSLPEEITLTGFVLNRELYINDGRDWRGVRLNILPSLSLRNHSKEFNWGYGGSGPAQLALAFMLLYFNGAEAISLYQTFKATVVVSMPDDNFTALLKFRDFMMALVGFNVTTPRPVSHFLSFEVTKLEGMNMVPGYSRAFAPPKQEEYEGQPLGDLTEEAPRPKLEFIQSEPGKIDLKK